MCGDAPARRESRQTDRDIWVARRRRPTRYQGDIHAMCNNGNPEDDLDNPDYDAFNIHRKAQGRKDGWWNQSFRRLAAALTRRPRPA